MRKVMQQSHGDRSRLCYLGHALMESRHGLAVDIETTQASGTAAREGAKTMVARTVADKGYHENTTDLRAIPPVDS